MFCKLCVAVVLIHSIVVADIHARNKFTSKSISLTTLIGETVEFNCAEYNTISLEFTTQLIWYKNEELLREVHFHKMFLHGFDDTLRITNVTNENAGTYKCVTLNQSHSDYSIYTLTVNGLPELKPYNVYTSNITASYGQTVYIWRMIYMNLDSDKDNNQNLLYLKDGVQLFSNESIRQNKKVDKGFDLVINNIRYEDNGTYKYGSSNKFRTDYGVTYLNVVRQIRTNEYWFYDEILTINLTKHLNEEIIFNCNVGTWLKNDKPLNTSYKINSVLHIKNITSEDAAIYRCNKSYKDWTYKRSIKLNVIDRPEKLSFRLFNSNVSLIIGETFQFKCHIFQSTENYTTWYSWKKNGEKLELNNNTKNMYLKKNQSILKLSNLTSNEIGIYECEAESYYHKVYSTYALTISYKHQQFIQDNVQDKRNNIELVNSILGYSAYIVIFILIGAVTILCCVLWLRRKKVMAKESKANKSQCVNGNLEEGNADLDKEEKIYESISYDNICAVINSPWNRSTMSSDNSGLHLENSIEKKTDILPYENHWEFPKNKLKLGKRLGSGAFGEVFKAEAIGLINKTSTTVAVKKVKTVTDPLQAKALIDELEIMFQIGKHLNLVNFLGTCKGDSDNNLMLILEYCRYGNLRDYLLKQRNGFINQVTSDGLLKYDTSKTIECHLNDRSVPTDLDNTRDNVLNDEDDAACSNNNHGDCNNENIPSLCTHDLISWSFQISRGMEYLSSKRILHRDLATRNILLADDNIVKICDFGLAKTLVYQNHDIYTMTNNVRLPWKWMAIESLFDRVFSTQSDVWSFGIVLWELFSLAETPYPNIQSINYLCEKLISGYRMEQPIYANCEIYNIMFDCWKADPKSRPSFSDLHKRFSLLIQASSKNHYLNLNEEFIRMNPKTSHSIIHIENIISPLNRSSLSSENSGLQLKISKQSESKDEIEMKQIFHDQGQE